MLDFLGVPWVTAAGEAEAMCAFLDSQGLVDGCITNDGDAFLYGARTVYRNFNMNSKVCKLKVSFSTMYKKRNHSVHHSQVPILGLELGSNCLFAY